MCRSHFYDANFAPEQAKSTEVGNRTLVFTIINITFAPLAFLAALSAISTEEVPQTFKQEVLSGLDVVYMVFIGLGLGTAGITILVALSYHWVWALGPEAYDQLLVLSDCQSCEGNHGKSTEIADGQERLLLGLMHDICEWSAIDDPYGDGANKLVSRCSIRKSATPREDTDESDP